MAALYIITCYVIVAYLTCQYIGLYHIIAYLVYWIIPYYYIIYHSISYCKAPGRARKVRRGCWEATKHTALLRCHPDRLTMKYKNDYALLPC